MRLSRAGEQRDPRAAADVSPGLLAALGPVADDFIIAGAQAIKFAVQDASGTKDVDFVLNVMALRRAPLQLDTVLKQLGYRAIAGARNFQFEKPISNSRETMRIEFMAPEEFKLPADFRVDVQQGFMPAPVQAETVRLLMRVQERGSPL